MRYVVAYRHLRHVHESLDAVVARHRGGIDRGFQVGRLLDEHMVRGIP
jgi:hypothetical protein